MRICLAEVVTLDDRKLSDAHLCNEICPRIVKKSVLSKQRMTTVDQFDVIDNGVSSADLSTSDK